MGNIAAGCGIWACATTAFVGVSAAAGAAGGAIGWSVLRAAGWKSVEFGYTQGKASIFSALPQ